MGNKYLGIDCGSVSVKLAIVNEKDKVINSIYLRNQGLIETIQKGLEHVVCEGIKGVGVTGSGRNFAGLLVGADLIKTEILAHTIGTLKYYPNVRTIFDIGGEDSKLMVLNNGILEDFRMNMICSAGTGSSLEAIATRMGIKIEDVGDLALQSYNKIDFPTKCGVFMQSTVVSKLNSGQNKSDILMGVCRGLVNNYLTMAKGIDLKPPFIYQGATAKNKAIVKAFEEQLDYEVIVPDYCDVMGAIGIALMIKNARIKQTRFKGFNLINHDFETKIRNCEDCENNCELNEIYQDSKLIGTLGSRCGKYNNHSSV